MSKDKDTEKVSDEIEENLQEGKEAKKSKKAETTASGKTEKIKLAKDALNPRKTTEDICVNGRFYTVKLGEEVEVPVPVASLLRDVGRI